MVAATTALLMLTLSIGFLAVVLLWRHAEAERKRAEDDLSFADSLLSEITTINYPGTARTPSLRQDDVIGVLQRTRNHILHLLTQRPDDSTTCNQLALGWTSSRPGHSAQKALDKSRTLVAECLENLNRSLQSHPRDRVAMDYRFSTTGRWHR